MYVYTVTELQHNHVFCYYLYIHIELTLLDTNAHRSTQMALLSFLWEHFWKSKDAHVPKKDDGWIKYVSCVDYVCACRCQVMVKEWPVRTVGWKHVDRRCTFRLDSFFHGNPLAHTDVTVCASQPTEAQAFGLHKTIPTKLVVVGKQRKTNEKSILREHQVMQ